MDLFCERCQNKIGETRLDAEGVEVVCISVKIRGKRRREYVVQQIYSVTCDWCEHIGKPFPVLHKAEISKAKVSYAR